MSRINIYLAIVVAVVILGMGTPVIADDPVPSYCCMPDNCGYPFYPDCDLVCTRIFIQDCFYQGEWYSREVICVGIRVNWTMYYDDPENHQGCIAFGEELVACGQFVCMIPAQLGDCEELPSYVTDYCGNVIP